jgi:hypothetical protein
MTSGNVEMSFDGIVTDAMRERIKRDYYLGPNADFVLGDSSELNSRTPDREK